MTPKQLLTQGIMLRRTNYGEADRILTVITPDHGKLRLLAKGVRKVKSKLAGGIELFSISQLSFIRGRGEINTLASTRLITHYGQIVKDLDRTMLGYELLKRLDQATEDAAGVEYYELLATTLAGLDNNQLELGLLEAWFNAQLLKLAGHSPNLKTDAKGQTLSSETSYGFDFDKMAFASQNNGPYQADHIKLIRLFFGLADPLALAKIKNIERMIRGCQSLTKAMITNQLHLRY